MKRFSISNLLTLFLFGASLLVASRTAFVAQAAALADPLVLAALGWALAMAGAACTGSSVLLLADRLLKLRRD